MLLVVDYFDYAAHPGASAHCAAHCRLLRLRRASGCLGTSCGSSPGSSSTTSTTPRVQVPRHVARLVTRLVTPLVIDYSAYAARPSASTRRAARHPAHNQLLHLRRASGCFDTSRKLVTDYLAYAVRLGASARCAARHAARRRLLRLRRAFGSLGTSRGSSSTTSTTPRIRVPRHVVRLVTRLFVNYFDYVVRAGTSPCRAARHAARRAARR
jgi:hypothetical protein